MNTVFFVLDIFHGIYVKNLRAEYPFISFPSHVNYGHLTELAQENIEICKNLEGEDRSDFIQSHLDDYYFAMNVVTAPKVLRYYRIIR